MKKLIKTSYLLILLSIFISCSDSRYQSSTINPGQTVEITNPEETSSFTNVFMFSETDILKVVKYTNVRDRNKNLINSLVTDRYIRRTFADFFFYNQVVLLLENEDGQYGVNSDDYLLNNQVNPLESEENAYWSYDEIIEVNSILEGFDFINGFAPRILPDISEIVFKLALSIDEDGYLDKSIGRILVALVTGEGIISLKLDLSKDMNITSNTNSKDIEANFSDYCANIYFKGTLTTDPNGEFIVENVDLSFVNASSSYKDLSCNYGGTLPTYNGVNNLPMSNINIPYSTSGTTNSTTNIAPYDLVYEDKLNTKKRVLFNDVSMIEIVEE